MTGEGWRSLATALLAISLLLCAGSESGLAALDNPEVTLAKLPREARDTVALIKRGGPYPYLRDGAVFGNYERMLPPRDRGYYREYTVPTPGTRDRGARRIVVGAGAEYYYTDDHYRSFRRIRE